MAQVQVSDLRKVYGATEVLRDVSLVVEDGQFVALVGPSGCGKSTMLRMIAGLESITGGEVSIGDKVVNDMQPKDRDIAMVFQNYALYPNKTVKANMSFPLKMNRVPKAEIERKVAEVAETLGLTEYLGRYPKQLSGGQRQRVAMGRAIVRDPKVFLFDEPLSNLDAKLRVKMRAEIKELHQRLKTTTIFVTHDQVEAMTMADKIVVMRDGNLEQFGDPLELYDAPVNKFVASFIGSPAMNFLEGKIDGKKGALKFVTAAGLSIAVPDKFASITGQPVTLGVRPEHIEMEGESSGDAVPITVMVVEPTGPEASFVLRSGDDELVAIKRGRNNFAPGSTVWIRPLPEHLHFFDAGEKTIFADA